MKDIYHRVLQSVIGTWINTSQLVKLLLGLDAKVLGSMFDVLKPDRLLLSSLDEESKQRNQATIITSSRLPNTPPELWRAFAQLYVAIQKSITNSCQSALLVLLCVSCLRVERIEELNGKPELFLDGEVGVVMDSVKWISGRRFAFELRASDPDGNLDQLRFEVLTGDGTLFQWGLERESELELGGSQLFYQPRRTGTHVLQFEAEDLFRETTDVQLELAVFENLSPVARFDLISPEVKHDPLEYEVDASGSYDGDEAFGGGIVAYEYSFLGKVVVLPVHRVRIIFPEEGIYDVGVRVKDSDGEWSEVVERGYLVDGSR